jgi:hypothetical protein
MAAPIMSKFCLLAVAVAPQFFIPEAAALVD